ncbi:nuclear transport factor 2 family protein [Pedobacter antarcticus]|uniref:nuclear transport factor 2 family protein n=1 Tax=Pedobacter antarcticus TaxID=34086 RepID=UPI000888202A|nr:nuclear transport factor 2 family protein [Pedobacter antarcticus]SDM25312.1 Ketosteroid isomerase-related protein [Pedobacter antarcticus]
MKKLTLTISILLSAGIEIIAKPISYLPDQNTFQPVINAQKTRNWNYEIRTIDLDNSIAGKVIDNGESLAIKLYGSKPDSSITESIHIQKQAKMKNATILHKANEFVKKGNYESFLTYCTQDTKWVFVGERILEGRDKVREYMKEFYLEPPVFTVEKTIEDGSYVTVTGEITLKAANGTYNHYDYCDVWRFENGKIAELKAFVIEKKS